MTEYKAVIKDAELAKEIEEATARYQEELCVSLQRAKPIESADDYKRLSLAIGYVLAELGSSISFPIYRQHPSLTPEVLKDIIAKDILKAIVVADTRFRSVTVIRGKNPCHVALDGSVASEADLATLHQLVEAAHPPLRPLFRVSVAPSTP